MLKKLGYFILIFQLFVSSCGEQNSGFKIEESELPQLNVEVKRYGKALFELDTSQISKGLQQIKQEFKYFLDSDLNDSNNIKQIYDFVSDTALINIYKKSIEVYPDNEFLNKQLNGAFKYFNYYYPQKPLPKVYTYISGLQYENPIWIQDSIMVIALDIYLGADFEPYSGLGLPKYKTRCMRPKNLAVDVMKYIYKEEVLVRSRQVTLLDRMIAGGKLLYFLDRVLPETADSLKICYTQKQLEWAMVNEKNVWAFLIQNDLLFSGDFKSQTKLISDGPFTTGFSRQSPSRLGIWIGWQIVDDYMKNNPKTTFNDLFNITDSQLLLHESGYKP